MKKILFLLLAFCSFIAYAAGDLNYDEVNKYIREKLDRDKEITLTSKINKANNTLEGYSDEGKLCAVNSLKEHPDMANMNGMKNKISEKNGKLNPISEIYLPNGQLAVRNTYKLNKAINLFETGILLAYIDGEINYDDQLKPIADAVDSIKIETYENGKVNQKVAIKNGLFNGKIEKFSDKSGKLVGTGTMKNGLPDGEFIEYDEAGKVISKAKYKDGKEVT